MYARQVINKKNQISGSGKFKDDFWSRYSLTDAVQNTCFQLSTQLHRPQAFLLRKLVPLSSLFEELYWYFWKYCGTFCYEFSENKWRTKPDIEIVLQNNFETFAQHWQSIQNLIFDRKAKHMLNWNKKSFCVISSPC